MVVKKCLMLFLFILSTGNLFGQEIQQRLCEEIFSNVIQPMELTKVTENEVYSDECAFRFVVADKGDVLIRVEKYNTNKQAQQKLENMLYLFTIQDKITETKYPFKEVKSSGFWDTSATYQKERVTSFALLRKQEYLITILANDVETIFSFDKLFRKVNF